MPYNTDSSFPPAGNPVYRIDREWCMGDSLGYLNSNFQSLDSRVDTLSTEIQAVNSTVQNTNPGLAKAWVNFDENGAILDSYNIVSVGHPATGTYTINLSADTFTNSNYVIIGTAVGTADYLNNNQDRRALFAVMVNPEVTKTVSEFGIYISYTAGYVRDLIDIPASIIMFGS